MKIEGRTFIISGGCSGLGLSTAIHLLSHGANVSLLDIQPPPTTPPSYASVPISTEHFELLSSPDRTLYTSTDVTSSESISAAIAATLKWITTTTTSHPLGGVICCAGVSLPALALPKQKSSETPTLMPMTTFDKVLSINLRGTVDLIRQSLPHLANLDIDTLEPTDPLAASDEERGIIIVVSSVAAYEGQIGQLSYSASKGAIASIVLPLARELGSKAGIRVVGIAPGLFESGMTFPPKQKQKQKQEEKSPSVPSPSTPPPSKEKPSKSFNPSMIEYPLRLGRGHEFATLVELIIVNPMINGSVIRLDGGVRMPSRL